MQCTRLTDEAKDREIEGLLKAMEACSLDSGTIVTESQRDAISVGNRRIEVVPFCEWEASNEGGQRMKGDTPHRTRILQGFPRFQPSE